MSLKTIAWCGLVQNWLADQKRKATASRIAFSHSAGEGPCTALVDEVGNSDHGERKGAEKLVGTGREKRRGNIPHQQRSDDGERDDSQKDWNCAAGAGEADVHGADYMGLAVRIDACGFWNCTE